MTAKTPKKVPPLRFPGFEGEWEEKRLGNLCSTFKSGTGITSKEIGEIGEFPVYGGNGLRGYTETFTHNGFFVLIGRQGALCGNINRVWGKSYVSEHAIAVAANETSDTEWLAQRLDHYKLNRLSESSAQPGLAVGKLVRLKLFVPSLPEQQKIASFLTAIDTRIRQLSRKVELLEQYKKGVMQKIFSQEIRFTDEKGREFPAWEKVKLSKVLYEHKLKSEGKEEVFSVSVHKGLVNQIEHLGRSFAAKETSHYNLVKPHDIVYTKSPTGDFPYGIIKQSRVDKNVIVSPLYGVFSPETAALGYILNDFFDSSINAHNYLHPIIQKGAKNTINITNSTFLSRALKLPRSKEEQQKIADFLNAIDRKIGYAKEQLEQMQRYKKGLLQQMFV